MNKIKVLLLITLLFGWSAIANAITISGLEYDNAGSQMKVRGTITFDSSYPTSGETLNASTLGMSQIEDMVFEDSEGYLFDADIATAKTSALIKVYYPTAAYTPSGTVSQPTATMDSYTPAGTNGTANVTISSTATTSGLYLVYYDTSSGTLMAVFGGSSHTFSVPAQAFTGDAAVLTGTVSQPTFTGSAAVASIGTEVPNLTNLSSLSINFEAYGN